jgi:hypothetical protein
MAVCCVREPFWQNFAARLEKAVFLFLLQKCIGHLFLQLPYVQVSKDDINGTLILNFVSCPEYIKW